MTNNASIKMCSIDGVGYDTCSDDIDFKVAKGPRVILKQYFSHEWRNRSLYGGGRVSCGFVDV